MKFKENRIIEIFSSLIGLRSIFLIVFMAWSLSWYYFAFFGLSLHYFLRACSTGSRRISISLAIVFVKIVVSKASDFFLIIYAVAFNDYIPKIKEPTNFLLIGAC